MKKLYKAILTSALTAVFIILIIILIIVGVAVYHARTMAGEAPTTVTTTVTTIITQTVTVTQTATAPTTPTTTVAPPKKKIAVVLDIGGRGDLSFNDMAYLDASGAAKDFGLELVEVQNKTEADYLPNLRSLARSGEYLLIVAIGFLMTDAVK